MRQILAASDPNCAECGGCGWRRADPGAKPGEPMFGRIVPCRCNLAERERAQSLRLSVSGLPGRLQGQTFERFVVVDEPDPPQGRGSNREATRVARKFASAPEGWLALSGPVGSGKTHLLAAIGNACQNQGVPFVFLTAPDLLDALRAGYNDANADYDARFEQLRTIAVLLLDDLGAEVATDWATEKLFQLLNHRYNAELPTVVATNFPLNKLPPRLRSRLQDRHLVQHAVLTVKDVRINPLVAESR